MATNTEQYGPKGVKATNTELSDWQKVKASLVELYGPGKAQTIGRWVRAGKWMDEAVFEALKLVLTSPLSLPSPAMH